jgi:hypothetical protein
MASLVAANAAAQVQPPVAAPVPAILKGKFVYPDGGAYGEAGAPIVNMLLGTWATVTASHVQKENTA